MMNKLNININTNNECIICLKIVPTLECDKCKKRFCAKHVEHKMCVEETFSNIWSLYCNNGPQKSKNLLLIEEFISSQSLTYKQVKFIETWCGNNETGIANFLDIIRFIKQDTSKFITFVWDNAEIPSRLSQEYTVVVFLSTSINRTINTTFMKGPAIRFNCDEGGLDKYKLVLNKYNFDSACRMQKLLIHNNVNFNITNFIVNWIAHNCHPQVNTIKIESILNIFDFDSHKLCLKSQIESCKNSYIGFFTFDGTFKYICRDPCNFTQWKEFLINSDNDYLNASNIHLQVYAKYVDKFRIFLMCARKSLPKFIYIKIFRN